jgi:arginine decarboxylase
VSVRGIPLTEGHASALSAGALPERIVSELPDQEQKLWSPADAEELYAVKTWSAGFFGVNAKGHVSVHPVPGSDLEIDVTEVIDAAVLEGCSFPLIVRFQDIISARVRRLNLTFRDAIAEAGYQGEYRSIYPIKVNQLHEVVAEVMEAGKPFNIGLECGSRAELMAALALISDDTLLLCNGVKDHSMLTLMLNAQQLGQHPDQPLAPVALVVVRGTKPDDLVGVERRQAQVDLGVAVDLARGGKQHLTIV